MTSPVTSPSGALRNRANAIGEAAIRQARLRVVPRVRQRAPRLPFLTVVSLILLLGIVGLLMFNTNMQQASFAAANLENEAEHLAAREQTLRMELDRLRDPQRVAQQAESLGMVIPSSPAFLTLDGKVLGTATSASPADTLRIAPLQPPKPAVLQPRVIEKIVYAEPTPQSKSKAKSQSKSQSNSQSAERSGRARRPRH